MQGSKAVMAVRRKLELIHGLVDALEAKVDAGMQEWYAAGRLLSSPPQVPNGSGGAEKGGKLGKEHAQLTLEAYVCTASNR